MAVPHLQFLMHISVVHNTQVQKPSSTKCVISISRICQQAALYQTTNVRMANSNSLHRLAGTARGNVAETTAGERNHLTSPRWSHTSITCSGRNPWWVSVGNTRQRHETAIHFMPPTLSRAFLQCHHHTQQDVKVPWPQWNWLVRETIARIQVASVSRIGASWQPVIHFSFSLSLYLGPTLVLPCVLMYMCGTRVEYLDNPFKNVGHRSEDGQDII